MPTEELTSKQELAEQLMIESYLTKLENLIHEAPVVKGYEERLAINTATGYMADAANQLKSVL